MALHSCISEIPERDNNALAEELNDISLNLVKTIINT